MKVHLIGSLLCAGLLVAATSDGAFAAEKKGQTAQPAQQSLNFNTSKSNSAGIIMHQTPGYVAGQSNKTNPGNPAPKSK